MPAKPPNISDPSPIRILKRVIAETSETTTSDDLQRARQRPPRAGGTGQTRTYVAIERALVLGGRYDPVGKVYVLEPDGRLRPATGQDIIELDDAFPNFIGSWRLPEKE